LEALKGDRAGQHSVRIINSGGSASSGPRRINEIVHGKRRITADTALRLARYFGTTDRFWLNLQTRFDLEVEKDHLGASLEAIRPLRSA